MEIDNGENETFTRRESHFPQPSFRSSRFDKDDFGVASPSDHRRPWEQPQVKAVEQNLERPLAQNQDILNTTSSTIASANSTTSGSVPLERPTITESEAEFLMRPSAEATSKEAITRESTFIEEFLADKPQDLRTSVDDQAGGTTWRQTALQRRSSPDRMTEIESESTAKAGLSDDKPDATIPAMPNAASKPLDATETSSQMNTIEAKTKNMDWLVQEEPLVSKTEAQPELNSARLRSAPKILDQLPEDDIDFLSAADIRASIAGRASKVLNRQEIRTERQKLEASFKNAQEQDHDIEPMIGSKIINDQLVRRLQRNLSQQPELPESASKPHIAHSTSAAEAPVESSIVRMKKWLEHSGAIFANHFWQDPTEDADGMKTKLFFDKVMARIRKGRVAMTQVVEDLEKDVPASTPLLKRLKEDEDLLDSAVQALRQRSGSDRPQALTPKKLRAIQTLRLKFQDTDRDLDVAYKALRQLRQTDATSSASPAFKRRLRIASKLLHKNAHLTRYLIWSLQARLEDPEIEQRSLANYKAVANSLLTLRDTQMTLARLVDRAMLEYGVTPKSMEDTESLGQTYGEEFYTGPEQTPELQDASVIGVVDKAKIRAEIAVDERLANEVEAQKMAMRGLSDDGYARAPKPVLKKTFDERSPLAHSLFRPFTPVLESLGKETPEDVEVAKENEAAERKRNDAKLIAEIKQVYEDTYGPITVEHAQLASAAEEVKKDQEQRLTEFEIPKEDVMSDAPLGLHVESVTAEQYVDSLEGIIEAPTSSSEQPVTVASATELDPSLPVTPAADRISSEEKKVSVVADSVSSVPAEAITTGLNALPLQSASEIPSQPASSTSSATQLPTHYTILIHDLQSDSLSITTSKSGPPRDTSPPLPLHQALSILYSPAKFIPYITDGLEVVSAKKDMLVLRDSLDDQASTRAFETITASSPPSPDAYNALWEPERKGVNPIDGTARLSPTGYVGPEESQEQLESEFQERRQAAGHFNSVGNMRRTQKEREEGQRSREKEKRRGGAGGVVKTAIWAAAVCYVVGVFGEIATGPFQG